jgi:hypothetical protein
MSCRRAFFTLIAGGALLYASAGSSWGAERSGVFGIELQTDKTTYKLHEPIKLRLTLHNIANEPMMLEYWEPWGMFVLRVLDAQDQTIASPGLFVGYREAPNYQFLYAPGEAHTAKFKDPFTNLITEWAPIKYWGYDLGVGTYQLSATAGRIGGFPENGGALQWFSISGKDRSNTVTVTVTQ